MMSSTTTRQSSLPLGQMRHEKTNPPKDTKPNLDGYTVVITGANTGIGFEAASKFVALGAATVVLGVRTLEKGKEARVQIEARTGRKGVLDVWQLDMLDYASIKAFATRVGEHLARVDIVVLNAGVIAGSYEQSRYGWEKTLQVNLISTTLLSLLLLPKLRTSKTKTRTPVLELVSSANHYSILGLATDGDSTALEIYNRRETFDMVTQYNVSKLFLEYAHQNLAQLACSGSENHGDPDVIVVSVCPGATKSDLGRDIKGLMRAASLLFSYLLQRSTEEGARAYISGTTVGKEGHGRFWSNDAIREPAPLLTGVENIAMQKTVWRSVLTALRKDVPDLDALV